MNADLNAIAKRRRRIDVGRIPMRELSSILVGHPHLIVDRHLDEARRKFGDDVDAIIVRHPVQQVTYELQHD